MLPIPFSVFSLLLVATGALAYPSPHEIHQLFKRDDSQSPNPTLESALTNITENPTTNCADTCNFVGAPAALTKCIGQGTMFDIVTTKCICNLNLNYIFHCANCMGGTKQKTAYNTLSDICYDWGFTSHNGSDGLAGTPEFAHPMVYLLNPTVLTQCEHATYFFATPYFTTSAMTLTYMPRGAVFPNEVIDGAAGVTTVSNFTWLVDYPAGTNITMAAEAGGYTLLSTALVVQPGDSSSCLPADHGANKTSSGSGSGSSDKGGDAPSIRSGFGRTGVALAFLVPLGLAAL